MSSRDSDGEAEGRAEGFLEERRGGGWLTVGEMAWMIYQGPAMGRDGSLLAVLAMTKGCGRRLGRGCRLFILGHRSSSHLCNAWCMGFVKRNAFEHT